MKLAEESQRRHLEAALANAKRDAAQTTAAAKTAAAVAHGDIAFQKAEVPVLSPACPQPPCGSTQRQSPRLLGVHSHATAPPVHCACCSNQFPYICMVDDDVMARRDCGAQVVRVKKELEVVEADRARLQDDSRKCALIHAPGPELHHNSYAAVAQRIDRMRRSRSPMLCRWRAPSALHLPAAIAQPLRMLLRAAGWRRGAQLWTRPPGSSARRRRLPGRSCSSSWPPPVRAPTPCRCLGAAARDRCPQSAPSVQLPRVQLLGIPAGVQVRLTG